MQANYKLEVSNMVEGENVELVGDKKCGENHGEVDGSNDVSVDLNDGCNN